MLVHITGNTPDTRSYTSRYSYLVMLIVSTQYTVLFTWKVLVVPDRNFRVAETYWVPPTTGYRSLQSTTLYKVLHTTSTREWLYSFVPSTNTNGTVSTENIQTLRWRAEIVSTTPPQRSSAKQQEKLVIEKSQFIRISLSIATIQPPPYSY